MNEDDVIHRRVMSDDGDLTNITITELTSAGGDLPGRLIDAIESEFADDDDIVIEQ